MSMNDLSRRIREARDARGWSQRDLARHMEVSQQTVAHWEQGGVPRGRRLDKLSEILGTNLLASGSPEPVVMSFLTSAPVSFSKAGQQSRQPVDVNEMFPNLEPRQRDQQILPLPGVTREHLQSMLDRILEISETRRMHRENNEREAREQVVQRELYESGEPRDIARGSVRSSAHSEFLELRNLREKAFASALSLQSASGRLDAPLPGGSQHRRYDYLSDTVVAGLVHMSGSHPHFALGTRPAHSLLSLAVAKATHPNLQPVLVVVVETGDIEEARFIAERVLNFDCQALRVTLRIVRSLIDAAEAIVKLEQLAPFLAKMDARENSGDSFMADGQLDPESDI